VIDQLRVPSDGKAVSSKVDLTWGNPYFILAYGTFAYTSSGGQADALGPVEWAALLKEMDNEMVQAVLLSRREPPYLLLDGTASIPDLLLDFANHSYAWEYTGAGNKLTFKLYDQALLGDAYRDNSGFVAIEIRQGVASK
jgi:hypothetical protein